MKRLLTAMLALSATAATAAPPPAAPSRMPAGWTMKRIDAVPEPDAIPLYDGAAPGETGPSAEVWTQLGDGQRVVRNVKRPTLTPVLPDPAKATGAAVIVAPGGGFKMLSMDNEGWPVARWLADHGIAAFVLKYRLNPTTPDETAFMRETAAMFAAITSATGPNPISEPRATVDALAALARVRAEAARWQIDPARVGMLGFSAGARTTLRTVLDGRAEQRPAFIGYIYGEMLAQPVPAGAPPMFVALAMDDGLYGRQGFGIVEAWRKAGRPVELHAYEKGEHGFGMGRPGTTTTLMMDEFLLWLRARGLLDQARK